MVKIIFLLLFICEIISPKEYTQRDIDGLKLKASFQVIDSIDELTFKTSEEYEKTLGIDPSKIKDTSDFPEEDKTNLLEEDEPLPEFFDAREKWPDCIKGISNQLSCGSCFAFSAAAVLSDRFCIHSDGEYDITLSAQDLVSCDILDQGCDGGFPITTWTYLITQGIITEECRPYTSGNGYVEKCDRKTCSNGITKYRRYKARDFYLFLSINAIKREIMNNGPIQTSFLAYEDLHFYKSGVYMKTEGAALSGGHACRIIGWGTENGIGYWLVANSWGPSWGINGYFKIAHRQCFIENVIAGMPLFEHPK